MSLARSFSTKKYYGSVTLGSGDVQVKSKKNDLVVFSGNIQDAIPGNISEQIKEAIYIAREKATGARYL